MLTHNIWMQIFDTLLLNGELDNISDEALECYKTLAKLSSQASLSFTFVSEFMDITAQAVESGIKELIEKEIISFTDTVQGFRFYRLHQRLRTYYAQVEVSNVFEH